MNSEWFDRPGGEPVHLVEHEPSWAAQAADWVRLIKVAIGSTAESVEHIGSTAVPGLIAKPVIDLQIAVLDISDESAYRSGLETLGLVLRQRETEHLFFRPPTGEPRIVHVHVCKLGSVWEREHLVFRDRLREDANLATAYADLKQDLAKKVGDDRFAYTRGKAQFIKDVVDGKPLHDRSG